MAAKPEEAQLNNSNFRIFIDHANHYMELN